MSNMEPGKFVYEYLKNAGSAEMAVNGSITPVSFDWVVPAGQRFNLMRLNLVLVDGAIKYGVYAGLAGALTNGVELVVLDGSNTEVLDFTGGLNIKTNEDWGALAGIDSLIEPGAGDDSFPVRFTIANAGDPERSRAMELPGGYKIRLTVNDDLSTVVKMRMMVQGSYE